MALTKKSFRHASAQELGVMLQEAHDYTLSLFECLFANGADPDINERAGSAVSSPVRELGYLAWMAEYLVLREGAQQASTISSASTSSDQPAPRLRPSMLTQGDEWFDINHTLHDTTMPSTLPKAAQLITYKNEVLDRILDQLSRTSNTEASLYPYRLALAREDQQAEHWLMQLQTLGQQAPLALARHVTPPWAQADIRFPGGSLFMGLGANSDDGFVFEIEKPAQLIYVPAFEIDSNLISNAQFAEFVQDNGYQRPQYWSKSGTQWLMQQERSSPLTWTRDGNWWRCNRFDRDILLAASEPVRHISLYEAQAYCIWAERRLPSEAEWEFVAVSGNPLFRWGDLWEWTCSPFEPYLGFDAKNTDFGAQAKAAFSTHQSVRGASFATPARLHHKRHRNFLLPACCDAFVGFRTCRL
ncbi:hypothetical protein BH11PSE12_BH11PSE12_24900 [soil metagenome]